MLPFKFNIRKVTKRCEFTRLFSHPGQRRSLPHRAVRPFQPRRFKLQMIRRAHQGYRNRTYGSLQALKIRIQYGRRPKIPQLRR